MYSFRLANIFRRQANGLLSLTFYASDWIVRIHKLWQSNGGVKVNEKSYNNVGLTLNFMALIQFVRSILEVTGFLCFIYGIINFTSTTFGELNILANHDLQLTSEIDHVTEMDPGKDIT